MLVADLPHSSQTPLRGFLARHAFDAPEPRAAVIPLVNLWQAMMRADHSATIVALVDALPYINSARLARSVLANLFEGASHGSLLLDIVERFGDLKVEMSAGGLTPSYCNSTTSPDIRKGPHSAQFSQAICERMNVWQPSPIGCHERPFRFVPRSGHLNAHFGLCECRAA